MIQVKHTFQEHKDEINLFYDFLDNIISHDGRLIIDPPVNTISPINVDTRSVAKSSFVLMLYNCVESTVGNCLNTVIREIESEGCKYGDLIEPIQVASLAAYDYKLMECDSKDRRGKLLKQQTDFAAGWSVIKLDVKSLVGSSSQGSFSGSLDAREIKKIFQRVGIDLSSLTCNEMKPIKDGRNKLAHGELSFQEYGGRLSIQYLKVCKDNTLSYLQGLIDNVDVFLSNKEYKR